MLNSHDLAIFFMLSTGGLFATSLLFAVAWIRTRERAYRAELALRDAPSRIDADAITQLQRTVDAVALEVERVGEAQRFVTRLLSERASAKLEPPRVVTPH